MNQRRSNRVARSLRGAQSRRAASYQWGVASLFGRGMLSAAMHVSATMLSGVSLVAPDSKFTSWYRWILPPFVLAHVLERTRPTILVLRRFGSRDHDDWLVVRLLSRVAQWARAVWLVDPAVGACRLRLYSPCGLYVPGSLSTRVDTGVSRRRCLDGRTPWGCGMEAERPLSLSSKLKATLSTWRQRPAACASGRRQSRMNDTYISRPSR
jgi:hypothetical protein